MHMLKNGHSHFDLSSSVVEKVQKKLL